MKNLFMWCVIAFGVVHAPVWASPPCGKAGCGGPVEWAETVWLYSLKYHDADLIAPFLTDNFTSVGADGKVETKEQFLAHYTTRNYSSVDWTSAPHMAHYPDPATAIFTEGYKGKGTDSGKPFDETVSYTHTWQRMGDGHWRCVKAVNTVVPAKQ